MTPNLFTFLHFILICPELISGFPNQIFNLGSTGSEVSPCATIITSNYCLLQVADTGKHVDVSGNRWTLVGAKFEDDCFLTIKDCSGGYWTTNTSLPSSVAGCNTANSLCCECKGCGKDFSQYENENSCAILFEHEGCSLCNGFRLVVNPRDEVQRMDGLVHNKVSSLSIAPGCEMRLYLEEGFRGFEYLATGSFNLPRELNDDISSYKCTCSNERATQKTIEETTEMSTGTVETTSEGTVEISTEGTTEDTTQSTTTRAPMTLAPNSIN